MADNANHEQALSLYSGPRRTYEIFCLVADRPMSIPQIFDAIPGEHDFVRSIVTGMVEDGLLQPSGGNDTYELTPHGREIKTTLDEMPADAKSRAYEEAWGSPPPEGY